jgi:hypothetical protein
VQTVPITTKVVRSNPADGEVYSMQHYVMKFVSDLRHVSGFRRVLLFPPRHDISEILLKVSLNTINYKRTLQFPPMKKQHLWNFILIIISKLFVILVEMSIVRFTFLI